MAQVNSSITRERKSQEVDRSADLSWDYIENGIVSIVSDVNKKGLGSKQELYLEKLQGSSVVKDIPGVTGRCKGSVFYRDPDIETDPALRSHFIFAYNTKFFVMYGDDIFFLRDVSGDDSNTLVDFDDEQIGRFLYIATNDEGASSKCYRYDGDIKSDVAITDGTGFLLLTFSNIVPNTNNSLFVGNTVIVAGTDNYDGQYIVTEVIDSTSVKVAGTYGADESGTAQAFTMKYVNQTSKDASRLLGYLDDSLVSVGIGGNSKRAQVSENDVGGEIDSFTTTSNYGGGFDVFGIQNEITATSFVLGYLILVEINRITFHKRRVSSFSAGAGVEQQESRTIEDSLTLTGVGSRSKKGIVVGEDNTLYIADEDAKAIWAYQVGLRSSKRKISASFSPTLDDYDMTNARLEIDKKRNFLICWVSSVPGGWTDTMLVYNFQTDSWGFDFGKKVTQGSYDPINKRLLAFDVSEPRIIEVFDGSYSNIGTPIKLFARTRPFNAGDEYVQKEYDSSSIKFGAEKEIQTVKVSYYVDENTSADTFEQRVMSDLGEGDTARLYLWGGYVPGSGGQRIKKDIKFKRYLNEDAVSDYSRLTIEIEEESFLPFFAYKPKVVFVPTEDQSDDF